LRHILLMLAAMAGLRVRLSTTCESVIEE
jgi:hypothetical protein